MFNRVLFILIITAAYSWLAPTGDLAIAVSVFVGMFAAWYAIHNDIVWMRKAPPGLDAPNGLSLRSPGRQDFMWELMLLLPVLPVWRGRRYSIVNDDYQRGWFVLKFFARIGKSYGAVIDIRLALGLAPTRWIKDGWTIRNLAKTEAAKVLQHD